MRIRRAGSLVLLLAALGAGSSAPTPKVDRSEIRSRAERMPIDERQDMDKRIGATIARVNQEATTKGQTTVAARLAAEFHRTPEALLEEKAELGWSWGELVIAHTLLASSGLKVTSRDLADLRSEGVSWAAIAFGLRFRMEDLEDAIKAKGRVAVGLSKGERKTPEK